MGRFCVLLVILSACTPKLEGSWTGSCTATEGVRVQMAFRETGEDQRVFDALTTLHVASRPGEFVQLTCGFVDLDLGFVFVGDCMGDWNTSTDTVGVFPFRLDADLHRGDPTDRLDGTCVYEELDGELELWRTL